MISLRRLSLGNIYLYKTCGEESERKCLIYIFVKYLVHLGMLA